MAGKEVKKFIIMERDRDQGGPFIAEDSDGVIFFNSYDEAKEYGSNRLVDPTIVNMY